MLLLEISLACALLGWLGLGVLSSWSLRGANVLRPEDGAGSLARAPMVSIILAARNEERAISAALGSLLRLDYPDYEVILVDDDSTDRTGVIADEWARAEESAGRLKVIHNRELPSGWRGKVHALNLAARAATGKWLLATDADVVLHPAVLRVAVSCALQNDVHLLSLAPEFEFGSFAERTVLPAFSFLLAIIFPLRLVNDLRFRRAIAAGAFILMRRDDYEALGGYASLRNVVIEDVRLAEMFKRSGRRIYVALTRGLFRTRMYQGWREIWDGLVRSAFEGTGFSVAKVLGGVAVGNVLAVLPWASVCALGLREVWPETPRDPALVLALTTCLLCAMVYLPFLVFLRVSPLYVFTMPLACVFYSAVALSSAWASVLGRGVPWKGRHYRPSG